MLLKWSKNADGTPRAKARLIVRGYADRDALEGKIDTAAPTTSRLSRAFLLSLMATMKWNGWTADVSTAFLQGLPQERKLWVKLPADALRILGSPPDTRMFLVKPCYGQLDAPRRWFLEAVRRLKSLGFRQHLLDPCLFLLYEADFADSEPQVVKNSNVFGEQKLCGMICLHVDDMLGCGNHNSKVYQEIESKLKETFSFREWQTASKLEYCGATLEKEEESGTWKLHHAEYLRKIKPIPLSKDRGPDDYMTPNEVTKFWFVGIFAVAGGAESAASSMCNVFAGRTNVSRFGEVHLRWQQVVAIRKGECGCVPEVWLFGQAGEPQVGLHV